MYEFLAPWGVLAPVLCAFATYLFVVEKRRVSLMKQVEAPDPAVEPLSTTLSSYRFLDTLSGVNG
jgi:hypothetical protein